MMILGAVKAGCKVGARLDKSTACLQKTFMATARISAQHGR